MKGKNLWRIIWVIGIYAVLVLLFVLIVRYKVRWEDKILTNYLYIYDCGDAICSTEKKLDTYLASITCGKDDCPYIKEISNNTLILNNDSKAYVYNLRDRKVINDSYKDYFFTQNDDLYIAIDNNNKYGIIDKEGSVIIGFTYDKILDYKDGYILYEKDGKMGIDIKDSEVNIPATYNKAMLFTDKLFIYEENNEFYIASYATNSPVNSSIYNFAYPYKDIVLVSINNQIDILDNNLKSKLIMKINSYYPYTKEEERATLNPKGSSNLLKFSVYIDNDTYQEYMYDLKNNKLFN